MEKDSESIASPIANYFKGRSVFITGATGFMGKVLLEKLLRSCPEVERFYLLVRVKRNLSPCERIEKLMKTRIFANVLEQHPERIKKIVAIPGDISLEGLGISSENKILLTKTVSVVFHVAATVKFDAPLRQSLQMNVLGTKRVLDLSERMEHLSAVVHVSTAYCNCHLEEVLEFVYPQSESPEDLLNAAEWMNDGMLDSITDELLKDRPNTYTYTKSLAETLIQTRYNHLPISIVRPSIVVGADQEPIPGWTDTVNGPTGMMIAVGKGMLHSFYGDAGKIADLIPVDMVVKLIIAAAWYSGTQCRQLIVYNITTGELNPITWGEAIGLFLRWSRSHPFSNVLWYPSLSFSTTRISHWFSTLFTQILPAVLLDTLARLFGRKATLLHYQHKILAGGKGLEYFASREWSFPSDNVPMLLKKLEADDQETFNFDVCQINWSEFCGRFVQGTKINVLKETNDPSDIRRLVFLKYVSRLTHLFSLVLFVSTLTKNGRLAAFRNEFSKFFFSKPNVSAALL